MSSALFSGTKNEVKQMPSQAELQALFDYDSTLGVLRWKVKPHPKANNISVGDVAGSLRKDGYKHVRINGELYMLHRLIWVYHNDEIPAGEVVDHINDDANGYPHNSNFIENLQTLPPRYNIFKQKMRCDNTSGLVGVSWCKLTNKWIATYQNSEGKQVYGGRYKNKYAAYHVAAENTAALVPANIYREKPLSVEDRHGYMDWLLENSQHDPKYDFLMD